MFALSVFLTFFVGRISFREGLPSNVTSRLYVFGTKGSALDSLIWIFLLVGTLAIGTVQLGNAIIYYFGWTDEVTKHLLYLGISAAWVLMSLFGMKFIARFNMVFVGLLFVALLFVAGSIAQEGHLADALTHGVLVPHVGQMEGFAYAVNYSIMTSGLMALFSSDFTRFVKKERDLAAISVVGSVFAVLTYVFGALLGLLWLRRVLPVLSGARLRRGGRRQRGHHQSRHHVRAVAGPGGHGHHLPVAAEGGDV